MTQLNFNDKNEDIIVDDDYLLDSELNQQSGHPLIPSMNASIIPRLQNTVNTIEDKKIYIFDLFKSIFNLKQVYSTNFILYAIRNLYSNEKTDSKLALLNLIIEFSSDHTDATTNTHVFWSAISGFLCQTIVELFATL